MKSLMTKLLYEKEQHETLLQIAEEEKRSLSEIVREIIDRPVRYRQRRRMVLVAQDLLADYRFDPALTAFTALDGEDFRS